MEYYNKTSKDIIKYFDSDPDLGLSISEVENRRKKYGKNQLSVKSSTFFERLIEPFKDLFMVILLIALVLSIIQSSIPEVIIISLDILGDAAIFYVQRFSTDRLLRSLKKEISQKYRIIRSGREESLDATELVPGDILILGEGEQIPADARIISETNLLTNESVLTGESDSVIKDSRAISGQKKVYERRNMVFSGSFVISGSAKVIVTSTGNDTEYGRIASLATNTDDSSPIQDKINKLVIKIAIVVISAAVLVFIIQLLDSIPFFESAKFTLAMIVSAIPEDLPIATAIILALGARRMAKKHALVKELRSIESIGVVTTVVSDKTGTLTENRLSVQSTWALKNSGHFDDFLIRTALEKFSSGDPMDICLWKYAEKKHLFLPEKPIHSYIFDQNIRMSGNLFEEKSGKKKIYIKGAPEIVLKHCSLTEKEKESINLHFEEYATFGYKVLAIAVVSPEHEINELSRLSASEKFTFLGLVAVSDTIRREASSAIAEAARAGVKVKMLTGDHAGTAFSIGKQLKLAKSPEEVLDCSKLTVMNDEILSEKIKSVSIFARVTPEDKYRILEVMKKHEIVAMTGDGVNDVPALTNAHVGIAMGDGPSIVENAGDIVLLDNNFKNIVEAIKEGRIVLANIRRMLIYLLSTNAGEVLTMIFGLLFGRAQLLLPIQILWVNLVTDSVMIIPIGLEPPESRFLRQKPEKKDSPILSRIHIERMIIISITMAAITLGIYFYSSTFLTHAEANTLAFVALVTMQWANAFNVRGIYDSVFKRLKVKNPLFFLAFVVAIGLQILALFSPLAGFLSLVSVPPIPLIETIVISFILPILVVEIHKLCCKKYYKK